MNNVCFIGECNTSVLFHDNISAVYVHVSVGN